MTEKKKPSVLNAESTRSPVPEEAMRDNDSEDALSTPCNSQIDSHLPQNSEHHSSDADAKEIDDGGWLAL